MKDGKAALARSVLFACLASLSAASSASAASEAFSGRVVGVHDGDTLTVLLENHSTKRIRLAEIDAPECGQPGSRNSKKALSDIVYGHNVVVTAAGTSYDRVIGWVSVDGKIDASAGMIDRGQAWVEPRYVKRRELLDIERTRRSQRVGLWALQADQLMPPWDWRHSGHLMQRDCNE